MPLTVSSQFLKAHSARPFLFLFLFFCPTNRPKPKDIQLTVDEEQQILTFSKRNQWVFNKSSNIKQSNLILKIKTQNNIKYEQFQWISSSVL